MCTSKSDMANAALALSASVEKVVAAQKGKRMADAEYQKQQQRSSLVQVILGLIVNFSSLAPSMSLGFSAIALPALVDDNNPYKLDDSQSSWVASIASVATPVGCFISGPISDKFGRKIALLTVNVICLLGWIIISIAYFVPEHQYSILLIGRLITGLSTGLASMPASVYMAEVSSPNLRGMFTTWNATSFALGVLVVYVFGWIFPENWGAIAAITAIFPFIGLFLIIFCISESPAWLITRNRVREAKASMCKVFGVKDYTYAVQEEIETLIQNREKSLFNENSTDSTRPQFINNMNMLFRPVCLKPFALILTYFFFQQFSGVFVIVFYAVDIVKEVKVIMDPYFAICLIALTRMVAAIIVSYISKKYGRRPLSLVSGAGMTLCMITIAAYLVFIAENRITPELAASLTWLPISLLMIYFFTSTFGFLTMPFAMAAEVFPAKVRGLATGLITCLAYLFNFIIVKMYPMMMKEMGNYKVFFFYGAMSLLGTIFIAVLLPETKGKTLQEIEEYFGGKTNKRNDDENGTEITTYKLNGA